MVAKINYSDSFRGRRAVVMGGSMAGLCAARVASDHFDEVVLVERDALDPSATGPRKGVPQGRHLHALLARGEQLLGDLFPGLGADLEREGATRVDFAKDLAWHHFGGWKTRTDSGVRMLCTTRPLLESHVRRRVLARAGMTKLDEHEVEGLTMSQDKRRLSGILVRPRGGSGVPEEISADLVIDAMGRGSRTPNWLEELGFSRPEETTVKVRVGYASRIYRRPDPSPHPWQALFVVGAPTSHRLGAIFPVEGGRWMTVLAGIAGDHPSAEPEAFLDFAKNMPTDELYRALRDAEPLTDIETYKYPAHLRHHYERLDPVPEGLAVVGDAFASFNPIFGQGMTTACLEAVALGESLAAQRWACGQGVIEGLSRRYHKAAAKVSVLPWLMSTGEDFRFPEIEGDRPFFHPAMAWATAKIHRATQTDPEVHRRFLRVMHMLAGLEELAHPRVLLSLMK